MFIILPWRVDVLRDRWPVMNWLIIAVTIAVFVLQIADRVQHESRRVRPVPDGRRYDRGPAAPPSRSVEPAPQEPQEIPDITSELKLRGWSLKGLFGYMWLHGGLLHLLGNMLFLWIFGNAVCAKLGNLKYLPLYVVFGFAAGVAHLLGDSDPALGASGAINGVVGMYLVLFYENEITCLFAFWFIFPYLRWFEVSSIWMILFWLFWDIIGALVGGSDVAYYAHLGGFAAGFGIALLMCKVGWIKMERYEKSLLQMLEGRKHVGEESPFDTDYARPGPSTAEREHPLEASPPAATAELRPAPLPESGSANPASASSADTFIRTACACGRTIRATRQYAGRTVRCPNCKQHVVIPHQTDFFGPTAPGQRTRTSAPARTHDHGIRFRCSCGKTLRVPAQHAGRAGRCPHCGAALTVPHVSE